MFSEEVFPEAVLVDSGDNLPEKHAKRISEVDP